MDRRRFVGGIACGVLVCASTAHAQSTTRIPRIGVLYTGTPATAAQVDEAFNQGLRENGYVEGKNILVERRFGDATSERLSELAADLVRLNVSVIVTSVDEAIATIKRQTQTIPIVMTAGSDPVATGFVVSLAHPGGNITGLTGLSPELNAKRLELLKEIIPGLSRVAIMWDPRIRGALLEYKAAAEAARPLRLQLQSVEVSLADDIDRAFAALATSRAEALIVVASTLTLDKRGQIASLALKHRLPSMNGPRAFSEAGGLMSYGSSLTDRWRRAATYVDKILKGAKPADLPVQQPTKFELVVNLKTAKALGLAMPPALLRLADEVIR